MGLAVSVREDVLNALFRGIALPAQPSQYDVALLTTNPSDDTGTGLVEVSTGTWTNYARVGILADSTHFSAPPGGTTSPQTTDNVNLVDFGTATTTANVTVTGFALYDHTSSAFKGWAAFSPSQIVQNGDPVSFAAAALVINM